MYTLRSNNCVLGLKSQFAIITCSHLKPVLRYIYILMFSVHVVIKFQGGEGIGMSGGYSEVPPLNKTLDNLELRTS